MNRNIARGLLCVATIAAAIASLDAHEAGTTQVTAVFHRDRSYQIEIATDADALLEKLETVAGLATERPADALLLASRLRGLDETFRSRFEISFDAAATRPASHYVVTPGAPGGPGDIVTPPIAVITLSGQTPESARTFGWKYAWTFSNYTLTTRVDEDASASESLEGDEPATPIAIVATAPQRESGETRAQFVAGFSRVLPHNLPILVALISIVLPGRNVRAALPSLAAFGLAQAVVLALGGFVASIPSGAIPLLVASTAAYLAVENLLTRETGRNRVVTTTVVGLAQGTGLGLPASLPAISGFAAGAFAAEAVVVLLALMLAGRAYRESSWYRPRIVVPASITMACVAACAGLG